MTALVATLLAATLALIPASDAEARGSGTWPLRPQPAIVAGFDPPTSPFGAGHRGVDLAGFPGQVVHAALAGQVTFAGRLAGRGVVVVAHGETRTTYEPVRASVSVGDTVSAGAPIGVLTLPLSHCFPRACLHWGWLRGETYLDPLDLVGSRPVRLMPWEGLSPEVPTLRSRVAPDDREDASPATPAGPVPGTTRQAAQARGWAWR